MRYKYDKEQFTEFVKNSRCIRHLLQLMGRNLTGSNYTTVKAKVKLWNIDITHWGTPKQRMGHLKGKTHNWTYRYPLSKILVENSTYSCTSRIKKRMIEAGMLEEKCYKCGITHWLGIPVSLELEHINGVNTDHRRENLTLLCPNCHAQTETYRGKNKGINGGSDRIRTGTV